FNGVVVHPDDFPAGSSHVGVAGEHDTSDDSLKSIQHHFTSAKHAVQVKQCDPVAILRLRAVGEAVKEALRLFLQRHAKSAWMQQQKLCVQNAALAAAHEAMHPVFDNPTDSGW